MGELRSQTQVSSSNISVPAIAQTYHMEIGYDINGKLVANVWPTGSSSIATDSGQVSVIRLSQGNVAVFDENGVSIPLQLPANAPMFNPLNLLGTNPGSSVLSQLVVSNVSTQATRTNSQLSYINSDALLAGTYSGGGSSTNYQWTYAQSGSVWVATQASFSIAQSNFSATRTLSFSNVHWNDSPTNDTSRANTGSTATNPPAITSSEPPVQDGSSLSNCVPYESNQGGSQNAVFQHGFFSSGCTWWRMVPWLNQDFRFGIELAPSLNSLDNLTNQGNALVNDINSAGGTGYVLIGHSQGGLISRYAAQHYQSLSPPRNPPITAGVLTLDTPHEGAPLAALPQGVVDDVLLGDLVNIWDDTGCTSEFDNILCYLVDLEYTGIEGTADFPGVANLGALSDLVPGSAFLNNLNSQPETFNRAAVIGNTDRRWIEARVVDEFVLRGACNPEDACGERNVAAIYGIVYDIVQITWDIAEFDCLLQGDPIACSIADHTLLIWVDMDVADLDYNILAADGAPEDGIVPSSSQEYPSPSALQYPINHADSHMGAARSDRARNALYQALVNPPFSVPTQASCSFSASPGNYSVAAGGGGSTFTVNTGGGCAWSSTSTAPWIAITAGSSGNSTSNVSFSVAANTSTLPRSGTVTVGNDASSAAFSIQEAGVCYYALSVNMVSIPSGGGSATATVWTSTGCQWSAVPNESWVTVTNGSGTGNGSFTVSTGANSQDSDLIGTVTVMGQTLTVILGNPVGTPGTGYMTINGSPRYKYVCAPGCHSPCGRSCTTQIYEYGSVTINIGGDAYIADYDGTENASQVATAMASAINAGSMASASASGSTVYITAKVNGSFTNYSLSTSYSYDTTDFTSPAFTAAPSGPSLTGGTD